MRLKRLSKHSIALAIVLALAVFARVAITDTTRTLILGDETTYHHAALNLLRFSTFTKDMTGEISNGTKSPLPTAKLAPGYPIYIAAIYAMFGESTQIVLISQILLSILTVALTYKLLIISGVGGIPALISTALVAVYPAFLYNIDRMLTEHLFTALLVGFAYFFLSGLKRETTGVIAVSAAFLGFAIHVRHTALPFAFLAALFLLIYDSKITIRNTSTFIAVVLMIMLPWWVRNWFTFSEFIPLTNYTVGPAIWGATPYFIDMPSTWDFNNGKPFPLEMVTAQNSAPNPLVYYRWRVFGFFQFMWGDLWDENLTHIQQYLRPFIIIQLLILVPAVCAIPFLASKCKKEVLFIACIPIASTLIHLLFHGLPRYVYPSTPFVFVLFGTLLQRVFGVASSTATQSVATPARYWQAFGDQFTRRGILVVSALFSLVLVYSVYVFAYQTHEEMSKYRLSRYLGTNVESLNEANKVSSAHYNRAKVSFENVTTAGSDSFQGIAQAPALIKLNLDPAPNNPSKRNVVTAVKLDIKGGYLFDYMTVYWATETTPEISEARVYKFPINFRQKTRTVYIDGDAHSLLVVPAVFRGGKFRFDSIEVTKYLVD